MASEYNVDFRNGRILANDKVARTPAMPYIDCGLGVFDRRASEVVAAAASHGLASIYQDLLRRGESAGLEVTERFYETGSVTGLDETRRHLSEWESVK